MRYITFDVNGFISGIFIDEISPINVNSDFVLITEDLALQLANKPYKTIKKIGELNKEKVYSMLEEIVVPYIDTEVIIIEEPPIDDEKIAMVEAITDLYETLYNIQTRGVV